MNKIKLTLMKGLIIGGIAFGGTSLEKMLSEEPKATETIETPSMKSLLYKDFQIKNLDSYNPTSAWVGGYPSKKELENLPMYCPTSDWLGN